MKEGDRLKFSTEANPGWVYEAWYVEYDDFERATPFTVRTRSVQPIETDWVTFYTDEVWFTEHGLTYPERPDEV